MFCRNCGNKIDDDSKFCVYCGGAQANASPDYSNPYINTTNAPQNVPPVYSAPYAYPGQSYTCFQPKPKRSGLQTAAMVISITGIVFYLLGMVSNISSLLISLRNSFTGGSVNNIASCLIMTLEIALFLIFISRKHMGYSRGIAVVFCAETILRFFNAIWAFAFSNTYIFAKEPLSVKITALVVTCITMHSLWMLIGSLIRKPVEKIAAGLRLAGMIIASIMQFVIFHNMEIYSLGILTTTFVLELPMVILLFIYPVLSKPIRN